MGRMRRESIWDHDLWADIYKVENPTQIVLVRMYRLILDMHDKDILAEQIALALKGERKLILSGAQKFAAGIMSVIITLDTIAHIFHF